MSDLITWKIPLLRISTVLETIGYVLKSIRKNPKFSMSILWHGRFLLILKREQPFLTKSISKAGYQCVQLTVQTVHSEAAHTGAIKKCNGDCYQNAPFQGLNSDICGVVSLICSFVVANGLVDHDSRHVNIRWLNSIYNYSDYARYVLIKWYIKREASLSDLFVSEEKEKVFFLLLLLKKRVL